MAALLAQQKFVATREFLTAPDGGLYNTYSNGGRPDAVTAELGIRWELEQIALRLWPSASTIQGFITAMFDLVEEHRVAPEQVERLRVGMSKTAVDMHGIFPRYKGKFEALLSTHYAAAAVLHDRALTLAQFEPARYNDPKLAHFAAEKVDVQIDPALSGVQAVVEARLASGTTISIRCDHPRGAAENPLARAQIEDKFRTYARSRLPVSRIEEIIGTVTSLESMGSTRKLMESLRADEDRRLRASAAA
jgi:2-methylcitrate dehydratase PrpD